MLTSQPASSLERSPRKSQVLDDDIARQPCPATPTPGVPGFWDENGGQAAGPGLITLCDAGGRKMQTSIAPGRETDPRVTNKSLIPR